MSEMQQQQEESARQAGSAMMRKAAAAHITHISHQLHCCALLMWRAMWTSTLLLNHLCCVMFKQWDNKDSWSPTSVACCIAALCLGLCLQPAACCLRLVSSACCPTMCRKLCHKSRRACLWLTVQDVLTVDECMCDLKWYPLSMITAVLRSKERS